MLNRVRLNGESDEFGCHLVSIVDVMVPSFADIIRYHSGTLLGGTKYIFRLYLDLNWRDFAETSYLALGRHALQGM